MTGCSYGPNSLSLLEFSPQGETNTHLERSSFLQSPQFMSFKTKEVMKEVGFLRAGSFFYSKCTRVLVNSVSNLVSCLGVLRTLQVHFLV